MLLQGIDFARIVQVYVIQLGIGGVYYFLIALLILRRSKKRLNVIFSMFFISIAIGTVVNVIYAGIFINVVVQFLNILTFFFFSLALVFLLLFNLIVLKSEKIITSSKQATIIIIWMIILLGLFIIGMLGGVEIDEARSWKPTWHLPFFSYAMIIGSVMSLVIYYYTFQIYIQFEDPFLKKKWRYFIFGTIFFFIVWFGTSVKNFLANNTIDNIWAVIMLLGMLTVYSMYYGVGKQIKE